MLKRSHYLQNPCTNNITNVIVCISGSTPTHGESSSEVQPSGLGVEIIADDTNYHQLLEANNMKKFNLNELVKYEDKIKVNVS